VLTCTPPLRLATTHTGESHCASGLGASPMVRSALLVTVLGLSVDVDAHEEDLRHVAAKGGDVRGPLEHRLGGQAVEAALALPRQDGEHREVGGAQEEQHSVPASKQASE
jgi:hypothetical protein